MKVNDIYKIRYTDDYKKTIFDPHHCFEGLGVVKEISNQLILADTFWGIGDYSGKTFSNKDVGAKIKIDYIGNLDDLEPIYRQDIDYLDDTDVVVLSRQHACAKSCISYYKKKGAVKSAKKIEAVVREKIEDAKHRIKSASRDVERLEETLGKILNGDLDVYF